jgi:hypothetical protein
MLFVFLLLGFFLLRIQVGCNIWQLTTNVLVQFCDVLVLGFSDWIQLELLEAIGCFRIFGIVLEKTKFFEIVKIAQNGFAKFSAIIFEILFCFVARGDFVNLNFIYFLNNNFLN